MVSGDHRRNGPRFAEQIELANTSSRLISTRIESEFCRGIVLNYEPLITDLRNDPKDRHVLAAAICCESSIILTQNLKHFRPEHLEPWGVVALHPDVFLLHLHRQAPDIILDKLQTQAEERNRSLQQLLSILDRSVTEFARAIRTSKK